MIGPYPEPGARVSGGVERVIDTLLPELAGRLELTLIVPGASRGIESTTCGVRTIYLKRGFGPGVLRYWTSDARRLAGVVERLRPDLIHLQGVAGVGRFIQRPAILTVHGVLHRDLVTVGRGKGWGPIALFAAAQATRAIEARARHQIGNAVIINPYVFEALPDIGQLRTFPIPNPVDPAFLRPLPSESSRERRILSVGRIGPRKNTLGLISSVAHLMRRDASVTLVVCGPPSETSYYEACLELIRTEGFEDRILLPGNLGATEIARMLDGAACLFMLSEQETAPMAITEAHARGVPVVAPEAFGIKYMITPGKNGFFLPMGDIGAQADVLAAALDHEWDRVAIAREAWNAYSPGYVADSTLAAYRDVMDAHRAESSLA